MARTGFSTANFLRYAGAVVSAPPLSIAGWFKTPTTGAAQSLIGLFNSGSAADRNSIRLLVGSDNTIKMVGSNGSSASNSATSTIIATNTWFHAAGVTASAASRASYLNGGGKDTDTTNLTASGINRTSVGVIDASSASQSLPAGGMAAECAIWNIVLSDADILALSKGLSPLMVRPQSLVAYWPLIGRYSPEINLKSNAAVLSVQGTLSYAPHCRIIMPPRRRLVG